MTRERWIWLDALKGWLIFIVVVGHAIQYCLPNGACENNYWWNLIYSFHMPAFMAASGFVNYRPVSGGILSICKRRSYQLLVPYLFWSLIKWLLSGAHSFNGLVHTTFSSGGFFWFLWALWVISIIFIVGDSISRMLKLKQELVIGMIAFVLVGIMVFLNFRMFGFQYIAYYFMFYAFGYYCNKYRTMLITNKTALLTLFIVWIAMRSFWSMHELPFFLKGFPFIPSSLLQYAYRFATAFVAIYVIFCIAPSLLNSNGRLNKWVAHLGQISLGVYVVHLTLIIPMAPWLVSLLPTIPIPVVILLTFVLASIISIVIVELLNKNKYTSRYLLGKI